jgi:hypothetical protein
MTTLKRYNGTAWEYVGLPSNVGMAPQTLGYAEITSPWTGAVSAAEQDISGLSVTVTVPEGRRIRITGFAHLRSTVNADITYLRIREDGNNRGFAYGSELGTTPGTGVIQAVVSPTAGSHTFKLAAVRQSGSGAPSVYAGVGEVSFILVEDITGSTLPYQPASVPVGVLAYAQDTNIQGSITTETILSNYSVNIAVPAGRQLRVSLLLHHFSTVASDNFRVQIKEDGVGIHTYEDAYKLASVQQTLAVSTIRSPAAGSRTYTVTLTRVTGTGTLSTYNSAGRIGYLMVEDITPTPAPSSGAPSSTLAYAQVVANQTLTAAADLTGLSATVTVPAGRRLRITGLAQFNNENAGANNMYLQIYEGAARLTFSALGGTANGVRGEVGTITAQVVLSPSAGTHTYKLVGTADLFNVSMAASADFPAYILVEDISGTGITGHTHTELDDTGWITLLLINSWVSYDNSYGPPRYRKKAGIVYLQGLIRSGTLSTVAAVLPPGFRPSIPKILFIASSNVGTNRIDVDSAGQIILAPGDTTWTSLSSITFPADQ